MINKMISLTKNFCNCVKKEANLKKKIKEIWY